MPPCIRLAAGLLWALLLPRAAAASGFQMFPPSNLYPRYAADPRGPQFGVMLLAFPSPKIPDSGNRRVGLKPAGRFGLLRVHPENQPERGCQIDPTFQLGLLVPSGNRRWGVPAPRPHTPRE